MAFFIKFQKNTSDARKVKKSLTDVITISGTLRADCSIYDPIIVVKDSTAAILTCNYMTIEAFQRSYFIHDIKSTKATNTFEVTAHVDVLNSFSQAILAANAMVDSSESGGRAYMDDPNMRLLATPNILIKKFPNGFTTQELVLLVSG